MRRISLWILSTVTVLVLLFGYHTSLSSAMPTAAVPPVVSSSVAGAGPDASRSGASRTARTAPHTSARTSTVTGATAQTEWGPVQVRLEVGSGTITRVEVLQYPNGNPRDAEINAYALPILVRETTAAQSSDIDMVSGATVTSVGYRQSLQSALDQAGL